MADDVTDSVSINPERKKSPKKYKVRKDTRSEKDSGKYPNYTSWKSRSGHSVTVDDNAGSESVTIQHRSGSAIQMHPDGGVTFTTHNGKYEVVFGEDRITVSGAQDITVKGDASMRVYGDYNVTCHNDYNLTVMGDFNVTSKNHNRLIRGNIDTIAKNETKKFEGSSSGTYLGGYARAAEASVSVVSRGASGYFGAGEGVSIEKAGEETDGGLTIRNKKGDTVQQNDNGKNALNVEKDGKKVYVVADAGKFSLNADDNTNFKTKKQMKLDATEEVGVTGQKIQVASLGGGTEVKSQGNVHVNAQGDAGLEGASTHVGRTAGTTHVVGATTHVEGTGTLNLNGGIGQAFGHQFAFNFGEILQQLPMPNMTSAGAQAAKAEPDAKSWTSRLA